MQVQDRWSRERLESLRHVGDAERADAGNPTDRFDEVGLAVPIFTEDGGESVTKRDLC